MIKVILESLDGLAITPRTGTNKVMAQTHRLPIEGQCQTFIYDNAPGDSPGVRMATDGIEQIGLEIKFYDDAKRPFKITLID